MACRMDRILLRGSGIETPEPNKQLKAESQLDGLGLRRCFGKAYFGEVRGTCIPDEMLSQSKAVLRRLGSTRRAILPASGTCILRECQVNIPALRAGRGASIAKEELDGFGFSRCSLSKSFGENLQNPWISTEN